MGGVVVSAPGRRAQQVVWRLVAAAQRDDPLAAVSVIVPSTVAGLQLRRAFPRVDRSRGGYANVRMLLGHELAFTLAQPRLARLGLRPRPALLERELVRAAMHDAASHSGALRGLRGLERHPATIDAVAATLADLAGVDDAALDRLDARGGRAAMIAAIERARRARSADTYDRERLLYEAAAAVDAAEEARGALGHVTLYAPHRPTPATAVLWRALAARDALDAVVIRAGDTMVDDFETATLDELRATIGAPTEADDAGSGAGSDCDERDASTHVLDHPSGHDEVRWVAADLTRRAAAGLRLDDAAIVVRSADVYPRIVAQVLERAAIPWVGRSPHRLASSSAGRVLLGALALAGSHDDASEGISRDSLFRWLGSGPVLDPATGELAPVAAWDTVSRRAGVVGGRDWERLTRYAADERAAGSQHRAALAEALQRFADALHHALRPPANSTWRDWSGWATALVDRYVAPVAAGDEPDAQARTAVVDAIHALAVLDQAGTTPSMEQFTRTAAGALDLPAARVGRFGEGVFVGSPSDLRGCDFEVVYVLGMAEGHYPPRGAEDPLLDDGDRAATHPSMPLQRDRAARERADHLHAIGAARERVLSFARADIREERVHRAAPLLLEAASALEGEPVGAEALLDLDAPWCTHVASYGASLLDAGAPAPLSEALVRAVDARRRADRDPATHPALAALPVVARAFTMVGARAAAVHGEFDGVIGPLDGLRPRGALSPTALEDWAKCSFSYFLRRVLRIDVVERPERIDEITPIDRGVLLHEIFDRFVREAPRPVAPDEPWSDEARAILARITSECCDDAERRGITGNALVWRQQRRSIERVVASFCSSDDAWRAQLGVVPWRTELAFGLEPDGEAAPLSVVLPDGGEVRFHGRIDRIDRSPDGHTLVVTDYKTGRVPLRRSGSIFDPVAGGRALQLPVYSMVAEQLEPGAEVSAYYRYVSDPGAGPEMPFAGYAVTRERLGQVVQGIVTGMEHGVFPSDPGSSSYDPRKRRDSFDNCRHCPFDRLCPTDRGEAHARKHDDPQLAPLHGLECSQEELEALIEKIEGPA